MKIVALMPVRNEQWVLRASVERALQWCDAIVILDHASDDDTSRIIFETLERYESLGREGDRVSVMSRRGTWAEMEHRQALLEQGRAMGGTHFALVDADEIITGELLPMIRALVSQLEPGQCLDVPMLPVWGGLDHVRSDPCVWTRAMLTLAFRDAPGLCWHNRADGYAHHHRAPFGEAPRRLQKHTPGVMHLQFADPGRLRAKHALYKMQEVLRWPGREPVESVDRKYSQALDETGLQLREIPRLWWKGADKESIRVGETPWQREKARELLREHGAETFRGLELWGEAD